MRRFILELCLIAFATAYAAAGGLSHDLFAFDNGTGRDQKIPLAEQASILKRTGYAGMAIYTGTQRIPEALAALDAQHLRMLGIYVHSFADGRPQRIDPDLPAAIRQLAGRETMIVLTVQGHGANSEELAIQNVREVADLAQASGLRVCLYPHAGFYIETTEDALRMIKKADRRNVGMMLNLYHAVWFHSSRCGEADLDLRPIIKRAMPHVWMVSINGIAWKDGAPTIERLGEGSYDVAAFLGMLRDAGYAGPVGLQGYQVKGDIEQNLASSLASWRRILARIDPAPAPSAAGAKKVLVYTRNGKGYVHDNIDASIAAIRKMGAESGFAVDASSDPEVFTDSNLKQYQAIVFSNSNNEAFTADAQREAFQRYIRAGGGFVGIHSAAGSERSWPWFWSIVGGKFLYHPKLQKFTVRVADASNPATKHLPATFEWEDECYHLEFLNPDLHPLLVTDPAKLDDPKRAEHPFGLVGSSMPLAWTLHVDGGREFYTSLGHKIEHYQNPILYQHILGGILWAMGERK